MRVTDLVAHFKLISSRRFIDLFEDNITTQVKVLRQQKIRATWWSDEVRQHLRYALFLRYYASFERYLKAVCDRYANENSLALRLSDIKSEEGFLKQVDKYLTWVVKCEPLNKHKLWLELLAYSWIRNQIVHRDGDIKDLKIPQYVQQLSRHRASGFTISKGHTIRFKRRFCYRSISRMAGFFLYVSSTVSETMYRNLPK